MSSAEIVAEQFTAEEIPVAEGTNLIYWMCLGSYLQVSH